MVPRPLVTARRNGVTWNPERKAHVVPRFAKAGEAAPRSFIASGAKGRQTFGKWFEISIHSRHFSVSHTLCGRAASPRPRPFRTGTGALGEHALPLSLRAGRHPLAP